MRAATPGRTDNGADAPAPRRRAWWMTVAAAKVIAFCGLVIAGAAVAGESPTGIISTVTSAMPGVTTGTTASPPPPSTAAAASIGAADESAPTIQSELPDYNPGQTVTLTGANWATNGATVHIVVNDAVGATWKHTADVPVSAGGAVTDSFQLPNYFVATYSVHATQQTASGMLEASSSFTDANPSANLDQCANDPAPSPNTDGCSASASDWVNGNL